MVPKETEVTIMMQVETCRENLYVVNAQVRGRRYAFGEDDIRRDVHRHNWKKSQNIAEYWEDREIVRMFHANRGRRHSIHTCRMLFTPICRQLTVF